MGSLPSILVVFGVRVCVCVCVYVCIFKCTLLCTLHRKLQVSVSGIGNGNLLHAVAVVLTFIGPQYQT
jgi:hypothetical protein